MIGSVSNIFGIGRYSPIANTSKLGVGTSSKPDGIKEAQISTEVEIAAKLVDYLRGGEHGYQFDSIIGIGHSFGRQVCAPLPVGYTNQYISTKFAAPGPRFEVWESRQCDHLDRILSVYRRVNGGVCRVWVDNCIDGRSRAFWSASFQFPQLLASSSNGSFCRLAQLILPCNARNDQ